jgi:transcriptional regulator with XRE-family HTH domain
VTGGAVALRDLGRRLAARREAAGLTQEELARRTNYSRSAISTAELGIRPASVRFWANCDAALGSGGELAAARHSIESCQAHGRTAASHASGQLTATMWRAEPETRPGERAAVRSKPVRITVDLTPELHRLLAGWTAATAAGLGVPRLTTADGIRSMIRATTADEEVSAVVTRLLRRDTEQ